jgi:hypothetical protein
MPNTPTPQAKGEASRKFVDAMKRILSVPKSEMERREANYQKERAAKKAKRKAKLLGIVLILASPFLLGCSTTPTPTADVKSIAGSQIIAANYFRRTDASQIEVLIKRDVGFTGSGSGIIFHIEGKPVAKLGAGQGARIYLKPGKYLFGVLPTLNLGFNSLMEIEAEVNANVRQVYRIYISYGSNNAVHIARTSE